MTGKSNATSVHLIQKYYYCNKVINNCDFIKHTNLTQSHQSFCVVHKSCYYKWYQCNRKCNINQCFCNLLHKHISCLYKTSELLRERKLQSGCYCNLITKSHNLMDGKLQHYDLKILRFDCQQPNQSTLHPLNVFSQNQF